MKKLILAVAIVAMLLPAAPSGAHVFTIHGAWRIGDFAVKRNGTLAGAIRAFGDPGSRHRRGESCVVRWPGHGLKMLFYNLGGNNPCRGRTGFFAKARAKGPHWRTDRGLERADRQRRLVRLYPHARFHGTGAAWPPGWWLVRRHFHFGARQPYPGLLATIKGRRVRAFQVRFPAGGD
jgi:hypothetical protein